MKSEVEQLVELAHAANQRANRYGNRKKDVRLNLAAIPILEIEEVEG